MGKRAAARPAGRESTRIKVYSIVILVIVVYVLRRSPEAARPTEPLEVQPPPEAGEPIQTLQEYEPLAQVDPALLAHVRDSSPVERAFIEPDAKQHLLVEASELIYGDLEYLGLEQGDWDALTGEPEDARGKPVWALGTVEWFDTDLSLNPPEVWGEIRDQDSRTWLFLVAQPTLDVRVNDVVRLKGFFFKRHDRQRGDGSFASGPLVVGEELLRSAFRIDPVTKLRPDLFYGLRDHTLQEASRPLASRAYYELLSFVQNTPHEELFPNAGERPLTHGSELMRNSDTTRGKRVKLRGRVLHSQSFPLGPEGENPLGVPTAYQTWLFNSGVTTLAVSLDPPPAFIPDETIVDVEGIYFRRYGYENKRNEARIAAVLIAGEFREFVIPPNEFTPIVAGVMAGIVLVVAVLLLIGAIRDRIQGRKARTRSVQRKKKLIQQPGLLHERAAGRLADSAHTPGEMAAPQGGPPGATGPGSIQPGTP